MIELTAWRNRTVAVMGLGRSGLAAATALKAGGADVWAWDDDPERRNAVKARALTPVDLTKVAWHRVAALVLSPGIPDRFPVPHRVPARARQAGVPIYSDVELLAQAQPAAGFIAVTGTNGKSTTTALIAHMLASSGYRVAAGGNLGRPALDLEPLGAGSWYVLELSSYQIERLYSAVIDIAVLVNMALDHIPRHGTYGGYIHAKEGLFRCPRSSASTAVVGTDDAPSRQIASRLARLHRRNLVPIATTGAVSGGVYADSAGALLDARGGDASQVADLAQSPALRGQHNWQNAAAAYAAATAAGLDGATAAARLGDFPGLPHRLEPLGRLAGLTVVNDSKATNPEATARALEAYGRIYWIAGGRPKTGSFDILREHLGTVAHAVVYGEAAGVLAETLRGRVPVTPAETIDAALRAAVRQAQADGADAAVILFSPASASFDTHRDFAERGDAFRASAAALAAELDGNAAEIAATREAG